MQKYINLLAWLVAYHMPLLNQICIKHSAFENLMRLTNKLIFVKIYQYNHPQSYYYQYTIICLSHLLSQISANYRGPVINIISNIISAVVGNMDMLSFPLYGKPSLPKWQNLRVSLHVVLHVIHVTASLLIISVKGQFITNKGLNKCMCSFIHVILTCKCYMYREWTNHFAWLLACKQLTSHLLLLFECKLMSLRIGQININRPITDSPFLNSKMIILTCIVTLLTCTITYNTCKLMSTNHRGPI
jgi:hypothetical protein